MDAHKALQSAYVPLAVICAAGTGGFILSMFVFMLFPAKTGADYAESAIGLAAAVLIPLVSIVASAILLVWAGYKASGDGLAFDDAALSGAFAGGISSVIYTVVTIAAMLAMIFFGPAASASGSSSAIVGGFSALMSLVNGAFGLVFWTIAGAALAVLGAYARK